MESKKNNNADDSVITLGEYIELRKRTNRDLLYIIGEQKRCIDDYRKYDERQKERMRGINVQNDMLRTRLKNQKKAIVQTLELVNRKASGSIEPEQVLAKIEQLFNRGIEAAVEEKRKYRELKSEFDNCKNMLKQITGMSYEEWMENARIKKEIRKRYE